ncbi:uncharacterized protein CEXT_501451 [Caerostris extrusa]|uniref:Uncharacterized protein n=1 Tax=Caerostris extrusa TaxID=172846 RepID=A0AAV4RG24_CAEEX|nr:uncharacterized protein CEXT_501451 [Caerostris extrusa]
MGVFLRRRSNIPSINPGSYPDNPSERHYFPSTYQGAVYGTLLGTRYPCSKSISWRSIGTHAMDFWYSSKFHLWTIYTMASTQSNYITRNVAANDDQLQLFKKLAELKRNRGTLPSEPTAAGSTFIDNGKLRYNSHIKEKPVEFEWYQNPCGLIATRTTPKDVFFLANFGNESLGFVGDTRCEIGGKMIKFEYTMCKKIKIYLSTNLSLQDSDELEDLYLDPGDAIIGEKLNTWGY